MAKWRRDRGALQHRLVGDLARLAERERASSADAVFTGVIDLDDVRGSSTPLANHLQIVAPSPPLVAGTCIALQIGLSDPFGGTEPAGYDVSVAIATDAGVFSDLTCVTQGGRRSSRHSPPRRRPGFVQRRRALSNCSCGAKTFCPPLRRLSSSRTMEGRWTRGPMPAGQMEAPIYRGRARWVVTARRAPRPEAGSRCCSSS